MSGADPATVMTEHGGHHRQPAAVCCVGSVAAMCRTGDEPCLPYWLATEVIRLREVTHAWAESKMADDAERDRLAAEVVALREENGTLRAETNDAAVADYLKRR
jgi:hypothetical protein